MKTKPADIMDRENQTDFSCTPIETKPGRKPFGVRLSFNKKGCSQQPGFSNFLGQLSPSLPKVLGPWRFLTGLASFINRVSRVGWNVRLGVTLITWLALLYFGGLI